MLYLIFNIENNILGSDFAFYSCTKTNPAGLWMFLSSYNPLKRIATMFDILFISGLSNSVTQGKYYKKN